jgi:hypothetical protein
MAIVAAPVAAVQTNGVLNCGSARTYEVAAASRNPLATVDCTLTSSGFNVEEPWVLEGFLTP